MKKHRVGIIYDNADIFVDDGDSLLNNSSVQGHGINIKRYFDFILKPF